MRVLLAAATLLLPLTFAKYNLEVYLRRFDNGQGFLANGTHCSSYWNVGDQCSIQLKIKICHSDLTCDNSDPIDLGQITTNANFIDFQGSNTKYGAWTNPQQFYGGEGESYQGFSVQVEVTDWKAQQSIDSYTVGQFSSSYDTNDFRFYSHQRDIVEPTLLALAWRATGDIPTPPPPTEPPTTTEPVTTKAPPVFAVSTCDQIQAADQGSDGVKKLTINGKEQDVYCQFGTTGAYTTIQSRGENDNTSFSVTLDEYSAPIGVPGAANNFWLGLDNMNTITSGGSFSLMIEVCCAGKSTKQYYNGFKIADKDDKYKLSATAILSGQGLDANNGLSGYGKDIGQPFRTYDSWKAEGGDDDEDYCDVIHLEGASTGGTGGWWFGNCGNNLNGEYYSDLEDSDQGTCTVKTDPFPKKGTGIEFITSKKSFSSAAPAFDGISFTRARMAIFSGTDIPAGVKDTFCTPSN